MVTTHTFSASDGTELFYVEGETLVAVEVTTVSEMRIGKAERSFRFTSPPVRIP